MSAVADTLPPARSALEAERAVAIAYAPANRRAGLAAIFALDTRLGDILRTTREPMVGQMRLTWWYEALQRLGSVTPPPAEPVLAALAAAGVDAASLAGVVDGWEMLLDGPAVDADALAAYGTARGGALFGAAGAWLGAGAEPVAVAGAGWALADLAANLSDADTAARARTMAIERLDAALAVRWGRRTRALGALALSARMEMAGRYPAGHPRRLARLIWHRASGR
jgi:phytoene synthase